MKRILLTTFFLVGVVLSLSAKFEYITAYVLGTNDQVMNYRIDRDAKMFYFAGDSPEDTDMEMRNYKKNGKVTENHTMKEPDKEHHPYMKCQEHTLRE